MEYKLKKDLGTGKKGETYVSGLHEVPDISNREDFPSYLKEDFLWLKNSKKEDNCFFYKPTLEGFDYKEYFEVVDKHLHRK